MNKMKVWECKRCQRHCIHFESEEIGDEKMMDSICSHRDFHETARYEITERKPDYKKMAARKQFGKFWDADTKSQPVFGHLLKHHACLFYNADDACSWGYFTPCAEPAELDPITMLPKEPEK